jgi:hypothetical protein
MAERVFGTSAPYEYLVLNISHLYDQFANGSRLRAILVESLGEGRRIFEVFILATRCVGTSLGLSSRPSAVDNQYVRIAFDFLPALGGMSRVDAGNYQSVP